MAVPAGLTDQVRRDDADLLARRRAVPAEDIAHWEAA